MTVLFIPPPQGNRLNARGVLRKDGRASDGFGSLRWVEARRRFELSFQVEKVRRSEYFSVARHGSRQNAERAAELRRRELAGRAATNSLTITRSPTVAEYVDEFASIRSGVSERTAHEYRVRLEHVVRRLGRYRLKGELTGRLIDQFYVALQAEDGKSPKLVKHVHYRLTAMLDLAVAQGIIPINPIRAEKIRPGRTHGATYDIFSADEITAVLHAAREEDPLLEAAIALMGYCALRPGELLGLFWSDLNLPGGTLAVQRGIGDLRNTKTRSGRRTILLPALVVEAVGRWRVANPDPRWVFPARGSHVTEQALLSRFHRILDRVGVRRRRCYDLRHTAITHAMAYMRVTDGISIADVARWAGHSKSSTTLDSYTHLLPTSPGVVLAMARAYEGELRAIPAAEG